MKSPSLSYFVDGSDGVKPNVASVEENHLVVDFQNAKIFILKFQFFLFLSYQLQKRKRKRTLHTNEHGIFYI